MKTILPTFVQNTVLGLSLTIVFTLQKKIRPVCFH